MPFDFFYTTIKAVTLSFQTDSGFAFSFTSESDRFPDLLSYTFAVTRNNLLSKKGDH